VPRPESGDVIRTLTWYILRWDLICIVSLLENIFWNVHQEVKSFSHGYKLGGLNKRDNTFIISWVDFVTFDVFEEVTDLINTSLLRCILRVHGLNVPSNAPVTSCRKGGIVSSLSKLAVRRVISLTGVGTERMRCDTIRRGQRSDFTR
jgi:hypothetical protein